MLAPGRVPSTATAAFPYAGYAAVWISQNLRKLFLVALLFEQLPLLVLAHFLASFLDHASHFSPSLLGDPDSRDLAPCSLSHRKFPTASVGEELWIGARPEQVKPAGCPRGPAAETPRRCVPLARDSPSFTSRSRAARITRLLNRGRIREYSGSTNSHQSPSPDPTGHSPIRVRIQRKEDSARNPKKTKESKESRCEPSHPSPCVRRLSFRVVRRVLYAFARDHYVLNPEPNANQKTRIPSRRLNSVDAEWV